MTPPTYVLPWWRAKALEALVVLAPAGAALFGAAPYRRWANGAVRWLLNDPKVPEDLR